MFPIYNNNITREVNKLLLKYYFVSIVFVELKYYDTFVYKYLKRLIYLLFYLIYY